MFHPAGFFMFTMKTKPAGFFRNRPEKNTNDEKIKNYFLYCKVLWIQESTVRTKTSCFKRTHFVTRSC